MTREELVESIRSNPDVLDVIFDGILTNLSDISKEYIVRFIRKYDDDSVNIDSIQYIVVNNVAYLRK